MNIESLSHQTSVGVTMVTAQAGDESVLSTSSDW